MKACLAGGGLAVCGLAAGCIFGPPPDDLYPPPPHVVVTPSDPTRPWPNIRTGQGSAAPAPTTSRSELVNIDLSSPKAAAITYYRAMAYGDAYAARAAVLGDDLTTRYIDAATAFSESVRDLYIALTERFGREAARANPEFLGYIESVSSPDVPRAIATGDVRITGDTATLTLRPVGVYPGNEEAPAVFKRLFGQWRLAMLASRRLDGIQAQEANEAAITNRRSAVRFTILARGVRSGQLKSVEEVWGGEDVGSHTAVALTPLAQPVPAPEPGPGLTHSGGIWPGTLPSQRVSLVNPSFSRPTAVRTTGADVGPIMPVEIGTAPHLPIEPGVPQVTPAPLFVAPAPTLVTPAPPLPAPANPGPAGTSPGVASVPTVPPVPLQPGAAAIRQAHLEIVVTKLAKGVGVNDKDLRGRTMLHDASIAGEEEVVKLLLSKGANVKLVDAQGWTPLHWAASSGHFAVVRQLLDAGADVNTKDQISATPLHWAAIFDQKETAEVLIDRGADVKAKDVQGKTPLHSAAEHDAQQVATLLLAKGATLKAKDDEGATPLHAVIQHARSALADLEITVPDAAGGAAGGATTSPILTSAKPSSPELKEARDTIMRHAADMIGLLLASGADVNVRMPRGQTPLHLAAWDDTRELAALLIAKGADVDAQDSKGRTPLEMARQRGQTEIVQLLTAKADQ